MTDQTTLPILRTPASLRLRVADWRAGGARIALVPTMGALHEGHLALIARARQLADRVIVSVFVNPIQFGPQEDFAAYPRREANDVALLTEAGAAGLYAPGVPVMYPAGFATTISVSGVSEGLCGDSRPGHFSGVATVVAKLLLQARPDVALFGEKDYQQLQVIRRMAADLDLGVVIEAVPTVRDTDGLALSSRNAYLSDEERAIAPKLYQTLTSMASWLLAGEPVAEVISSGRGQLLGLGFRALDYLELRDAASLRPIESLVRPARILAAAHLGKTRLIDNVGVFPPVV